MSSSTIASGAPGIPARWTSSAKSGVGTSINAASEVSFTLSHGIVNEVYFPREDSACIRDMGLIVTDGENFFSEEKRHAIHDVETVEDGVPAYILTNTCREGNYRITKDIVTDPLRDTLVQRVRFEVLKGKKEAYSLYVLLAPHLGNRGGDNNAWLGDYKGVPMLYAQRDNLCVALACSEPWKKRSVGYVGKSDGWRDLHRHKQMTWEYERADEGNVAMTAEIDLTHANPDCVLALGFGRNDTEAGHRAWASITDGFEEIQKRYVKEWHDWQESLISLNSPKERVGELYRISAAVLRMHESKRFPGAMIASLSIPWGFSKGDDDIGGYHLVWPRDLVESSGGLLALGADLTASRVLKYLLITQEHDGHWSQNMWLEGIPYWKGIQLDQVALPILLIELCRCHKALPAQVAHHYWKMVRKAVAFLVQNGPDTQQDRWEEEAGWTPFTLATEVAALVAAAEFAEEYGEKAMAEYCRQTADAWNDRIEDWTYVTGTPLPNR
ncbi:glycoside hydrolase family 15 protein [Salmonirosea aquatica]|uniref:glycoside hydrolase family 15 protein n=1 Tax=Salmonirosea aquatica TaxID=2654236 RepID=UPI00357164D1